MLIGATGSGKSTLVDGIVNYVTGVNFEDPFRFTVLSLENEEIRTENQVHLTTLKSKFIKKKKKKKRFIYYFCRTMLTND